MEFRTVIAKMSTSTMEQVSIVKSVNTPAFTVQAQPISARNASTGRTLISKVASASMDTMKTNIFCVWNVHPNARNAPMRIPARNAATEREEKKKILPKITVFAKIISLKSQSPNLIAEPAPSDAPRVKIKKIIAWPALINQETTLPNANVRMATMKAKIKILNVWIASLRVIPAKVKLFA